ncbi:MAG: asparagine synthase (glutamine-hydrolyzing) [Rhodospirillaceae bacterium]|jgi:asparagine synthase (glutamine-hydrolysing)|nr:asparagine synthase (glutamine-hydrolyzing) [Rhodospirillaceae bacterium]
MCGIAGGMIKTGQPPPETILMALQAALHHRGPDGAGRHVSGSVGLVHTRLAIVDPNHGKQPFVDTDGVVLVANGEIYNDLTIRAELSEARYQTGSDNESALHIYKKYGLDFARHLRGMYALALYDPIQKQLVLARDPFGIKPLYYLETQEAFWFASEPQALTKAGLASPSENSNVRNQLLGLQYTCGRQTIFNGIQRLEPGEVVVVKANSAIDRVRFDPWVGYSDESPASVSEFDRFWMNAVDLHRRSDVPYGVFLSSGTDSAAVLSAMARLEERPVVAFTAGFTGSTVRDEREQAARLAAVVGADHRAIEIQPSDFWETLPAITAALDDPVADYAIVPTYLLAKEAAQSVKVVLTGEGGDEIFAGYGRYRGGRRPWPLRKKPWSRHLLDRAGVFREDSTRWRTELDATEAKLDGSSLSALQKLQALDIAHWLPNDLLTKVDRCLMAHGVEGRVPFLDGPLASYGFHLPDRDKIQGRLGKFLMRRWLKEHCPESLPFERKRGFSVPVGEWIAAEGTRLAPLVANQPGVAACCKPLAVENLFKNAAADKALPAWLLLFYALWHQFHMRGIDPTGTVFDVLAERNAG